MISSTRRKQASLKKQGTRNRGYLTYQDEFQEEREDRAGERQSEQSAYQD
jgi:hypothetical protein